MLVHILKHFLCVFFFFDEFIISPFLTFNLHTNVYVCVVFSELCTQFIHVWWWNLNKYSFSFNVMTFFLSLFPNPWLIFISTFLWILLSQHNWNTRDYVIDHDTHTQKHAHFQPILLIYTLHEKKKNKSCIYSLSLCIVFLKFSALLFIAFV